MIIAGFQPLSLLDYPGIICSIVFTQGCPFRCIYCHNPELITVKPQKNEDTIPEATILETLRHRRNIIEGVCVTGGEPTLHPDLPEFLKKIKQLGLLVKLDTNGVNPQMVQKLIEERLVDYIAMDLKHTWECYAEVIDIPQKHVIENCQKTARLIQTSSVPHEFRTTVYPTLHREEDLLAIADQLYEGESYALQQIRYEKTRKPNLVQSSPLDLELIADRIRAKHPSLQIEVRA